MSSVIHHIICDTADIQNVLTVVNPLYMNYKNINFTLTDSLKSAAKFSSNTTVEPQYK